MDQMDDAAAAALWRIARAGDSGVEHVGALYDSDGSIARTDPVSSGQGSKVRAALKIPAGSLRGLFHNHPEAAPSRRNFRSFGGGDEFSDDDKATARRLGVPSYIATPGGVVKRFDPNTGETTEVLAQFPMDEYKKHLTAELLKAHGKR